MWKLVIFLCAAIFTGVQTWSESKITITADDCVKTIVRLNETVHLVNPKDRGAFPENVITEAERQMRINLEALIPEARTQSSIQIYRHERRTLVIPSLPLNCTQEMAYKIAKVVYDAAEPLIVTRHVRPTHRPTRWQFTPPLGR